MRYPLDRARAHSSSQVFHACVQNPSTLPPADSSDAAVETGRIDSRFENHPRLNPWAHPLRCWRHCHTFCLAPQYWFWRSAKGPRPQGALPDPHPENQSTGRNPDSDHDWREIAPQVLRPNSIHRQHSSAWLEPQPVCGSLGEFL